MKIVDKNNWDAEVEIIESCKKKKIICVVIRCVIYLIWVVCFALFFQTFYDMGSNEKLFWVCAISFLVEQYVKDYQKHIKDYDVKNLVFAIIDERTFIDAKYLKASSQVAITFLDVFSETRENFYVDCDVKIDKGIEEDVLTIYPNSAQLILRDTQE